jgi:glycosyltransferase involved in cell wall biosynthesis
VQTHVVAVRDFLAKNQVACAVINVTRFRKAVAGAVYHPRNALHLAWLLLRLRYDVIHVHIGGNLTTRLLALGLVCCLLPWAKTVLTFHSGGYPASDAGIRARPFSFLGFTLRRFDRLIGVNREVVAFFHRVGCSPRHTRLISPHAFPADAAPDKADRAAACEALPERLRQFFESHAPVLVTVGLLEPEYDLPLQIEVMAALRETHQNAGLVVIGTGSLEADLRALVQTKPYADHVLLCGDVPHPVTLRAIAQADLLLRTTWYDGDAISVREALHVGTPVVATDNRMRPDSVRLIPVRDLAALRQAIEEELATPRPRRAAADNATDDNLRAVLDLYRELLAHEDPSGMPTVPANARDIEPAAHRRLGGAK